MFIELSHRNYATSNGSYPICINTDNIASFNGTTTGTTRIDLINHDPMDSSYIIVLESYEEVKEKMGVK